jgi:hypothetical protein
MSKWRWQTTAVQSAHSDSLRIWHFPKSGIIQQQGKNETLLTIYLCATYNRDYESSANKSHTFLLDYIADSKYYAELIKHLSNIWRIYDRPGFFHLFLQKC